MEEEGIDWHDDKYYGQRDGMELHLRVHIDFEETVFYETYDFIPVGTLFTLLNEDTMLVEFGERRFWRGELRNRCKSSLKYGF